MPSTVPAPRTHTNIHYNKEDRGEKSIFWIGSEGYANFLPHHDSNGPYRSMEESDTLLTVAEPMTKNALETNVQSGVYGNYWGNSAFDADSIFWDIVLDDATDSLRV